MENSFETIILLDDKKKNVKDTIDKILKIIKKFNCKIIRKEDMGIKKLVYPVKNKNKAYYYLVEYSFNSNSIDTLDKIETEFKTISNILKFMSIKVENID